MGGRGDGSGGGGGGGGGGGSLEKYSPWTDADGQPLRELSEDEFEIMVSDWMWSSTDTRNRVQGKATSEDPYIAELELKYGRQFDNYLAKGKYDGVPLFRGVRMDSETLDSLQPGMLINQNGPASFSKSVEIALEYSDIRGDLPIPGFASGKRVVFVLENGTKAGRDIEALSASLNTSGFLENPKEVAVASCSHMRVTKVSKKNGVTYIHGTEEIYKYDPSAVKGHGTQIAG